jgi:predicted secreted protein
LRPGDTHEIRLPGLGTVGYEWSVSVAGDPGAVSVVETEAAPPRGGDMPGRSRDHVFVVTALRPGHATVHFAQRRPFEPERPPREQHHVEVRVS